MKEQIIRIPYKYSELFQTMEDWECWKLIKSLFTWTSEGLSWLTLTYYNIIIVDIQNIQNQVKVWRKGGLLWWRPKKKRGVIKKEKGGLLKKEPNIKESNINKDKINKDNIKEVKEIKHKYWEYQNVLLTNTQKNKFIKDFWENEFNKYIKILDEWIEMKWYKYKNHNLAIRNWKNNDFKKNSKLEKKVNNASDTGVVLAPIGF